MTEQAAAARVVELHQEQAVDDVADHVLLRRPEQLGVDVVTGGRDEGQQRAGDQPGHRQRQGDLAERREPVGVQVLARLDQPQVDLLQAGVERQHHERQEVVGQAGDHRHRRGQQPTVGTEDVQRLQGAHDEAVVGQDRLPGQGAHQEAGEERRDDQHQHEVLPAAGLERDRVGQRVGQQQRERGRHAGVQQRPEERRLERLQRVPGSSRTTRSSRSRCPASRWGRRARWRPAGWSAPGRTRPATACPGSSSR